jgi:hypothetical protein
MVAGVHQPDREIAIVGEEDQAPAIQIEPADRKDAGRPLRKAIDHTGAAAVVADAGEHSDRLVQQQIGMSRRRSDRLTVDRDLVNARLDLLARAGRLPIDAHLAGSDQAISLAAGGDSGAR